MKTKKPKTGTREWAAKTFNLQYGCENDCKYCYAKTMAARFNRIPASGWDHPIFKWFYSSLPQNTTVMFPSTHDITEHNLGYCCEMIGQLLDRHNKLLIVSKPRFDCIDLICYNFKHDIENIEFRFTIGSKFNSELQFWEPNAPTFENRILAVKEALRCGHNVSISCEPLLDIHCEIIDYFLQPEFNDITEIWIGAMNHVKKSVAPALNYDEIYFRYHHTPRIRFKESFRKHLSIPEWSFTECLPKMEEPKDGQ